jgi:hypothetical protein
MKRIATEAEDVFEDVLARLLHETGLPPLARRTESFNIAAGPVVVRENEPG